MSPGAYLGATFVSNLPTDVAKPLMAALLLLLGVYVLVRFTFRGINTKHLGKPLKHRFLTPLGIFGGVIDATGGGGWGLVGALAAENEREALAPAR